MLTLFLNFSKTCFYFPSTIPTTCSFICQAWHAKYLIKQKTIIAVFFQIGVKWILILGDLFWYIWWIGIQLKIKNKSSYIQKKKARTIPSYIVRPSIWLSVGFKENVFIFWSHIVENLYSSSLEGKPSSWLQLCFK